MFFNDGKGTIYYGLKKYFRIYFTPSSVKFMNYDLSFIIDA